MDTLKTRVLSCQASGTGLKVDSQPQVAATGTVSRVRIRAVLAKGRGKVMAPKRRGSTRLKVPASKVLH
jgi:hypothetical protein